MTSVDAYAHKRTSTITMHNITPVNTGLTEARASRKKNTMAKIIAMVQGGTSKEIEASTVQDVVSHFGVKNYTAHVNKEQADLSDELQDMDFVLLVPSVKGAMRHN